LEMMELKREWRHWQENEVDVVEKPIGANF
jgi:hypothetical protein